MNCTFQKLIRECIALFPVEYMKQSEDVTTKLQQAIASLEQEKKLLAYELHDNLMGLLVGTKLNLESIKLENIVKSKQILEECTGYIGQAIEQTRALISDLTPQNIGHSLRLELQRLFERYSRDYKIEFQFDPAIEECGLQLKTNLFRITQECLNNIQRHAQASELSIRFLQLGSRVVLLVVDNGVGFDPDSMENNSKSSSHCGFGLNSIQERAKAFGGSAFFLSNRKNLNAESLQNQLAQAFGENLASAADVQSSTTAILDSCPRSGTAVLVLLSSGE